MKILLINFASIWHKLLKHCIFVEFLLVEGYVQIALFVEHVKTATLGRSYLCVFASTWNNLLKHCISVDFLLVEGYVQGALRKNLCISPFVERFKAVTLGRSCG